MRRKWLCYHRRSDCGFCGSWHRREPVQLVKAKPRCAACGRFTKVKDRAWANANHCQRCVTRGFTALELFEAVAA